MRHPLAPTITATALAAIALACGDGREAQLAASTPSTGASGAAGMGGDGASAGSAAACPAGCVFVGQSVCEVPLDVANLPTTPAGKRTVWVATRITTGDETLAGTPDDEAWKTTGMNLDGLVTTTTKSSPCLVPGNGWGDHRDGPCGLDNAFGAAQGLKTADQTNAIATGARTWAISADAALPAAGGTVHARLLAGSGADSAFAVAPFVTDAPGQNDLTLSRQGDWLVSAPFDAYIELTYSFEARAFPLHLRGARLFGRLSEDGTEIVRGVLTGVAPTSQLLSSLCETLNPHNAASSSDLMADGSPGSAPCDGASFAIGFQAKQVDVAEVAPIAKSKVCDF